MPIITLFHATNAPQFSAFSDAFPRNSCDANSSLGVHMVEWPRDSLRYICDTHERFSSPHSRVLITKTAIERALLVSSSNDFFGVDQHGQQVFDANSFASRRAALIADGFDAVCTEAGIFDEDGYGVWVVLNPKKIQIIGQLTPAEAYVSDWRSDYSGVSFEPGQIFEQ